METVRGFVRRFPVLSFFTLAFGLSWMAWTPYILGNTGLGLEPDFQLPTGTMGQLVGMLPGAYLGPLSAAFIVTTLAEGRAGLRQWAKRLVRWRVGWTWYVGVVLLVPATILLTTLILPGALGGLTIPAVSVLALFAPMLIIQFLTTAMAEEPGWRDFALPRLQDKFGPVLGTTILGVLWGCWHLPLFFTEWGGYPNISWIEPTVFVLSAIPLSFVMTWLFNRTNQSLPLVMLFHAAINSTYSLLWPVVFPKLSGDHDSLLVNLVAAVGAAVVLIIVTRGRLGLQARQPEFRPEPLGLEDWSAAA
jgi:membrane protease YdiL (CAAX protease family)